jgi:integrase
MSHFAKPWYRKGRGWFLELNGKQIKLGDEQDEAFTRYHQLMAGQAPTGIQVSQVIDAFLDWCGRHRSTRTFLWNKYRCDSFWKSLKGRNLNFLSVDELKPHHVESWIAEHPTWNGGMQRGAIQSIQRAFNWAVKQGRIERSPIAQMEKPPAGRRENVITPEMYGTIIGKVKDSAFRELLTTAWETGCRPQEILRVEARHFDGERWVFPAKESKGKKKNRVVYLTPTAKEITARRVKAFPAGPIFRNRKGKPWNAFAVNCRFCRLAKKIGRKFALVDFRHSFVTRLLKAGSDPITISALCGHSDLSMIARVYAHVHQDGEHLQKALMKGA